MSIRVIFAGHTGLDKELIVKNFANFVRHRRGWVDNPHLLLHRSLEDYIPGPFQTFLADDNFPSQVVDWHQAMQQAIDEVTHYSPEVAFLDMHCMFYVYGELISFLDPTLIAAFAPTHIITLIDDVYEVWARIKAANEKTGQRFDLSLMELVAWRAAEISQADLLARSIPQSSSRSSAVQNYIVAVKHPKQMLYNLLFQPNVVKFYFGLPITDTRYNQADRIRIEGKISECVETRLPEAAVFIPLTIDEGSPKLFARAAERESADSKATILFEEGDAELRWPLPTTGTLCEGRENVCPFEMPTSQITQLRREIGNKAVIENQIRRRDYRLIDGVDCIAAYRPNYNKRPSSGMMHEFGYAQYGARPRKAIRYYDPEEDKQKGSPFHGFQIPYPNEEEWWRALQYFRLT